MEARPRRQKSLQYERQQQRRRPPTRRRGLRGRHQHRRRSRNENARTNPVRRAEQIKGSARSILRRDSNCDARGTGPDLTLSDFHEISRALRDRRTGIWSELVRRRDVQKKAHRIVLGQDGYCQGILRTGKLRLSLRDSRARRWVAKVGHPKWFER